MKRLSRIAWRANQFLDRLGIVGMIKIVCSFYQVLLLLGDIYDIPFPRIYLDFIYKWFAIFEFDFMQLARVDCVRKTNFYEVLIISASFLCLLEIIAVAVEVIFYRKLAKDTLKQAKDTLEVQRAAASKKAFQAYGRVKAVATSAAKRLRAKKSPQARIKWVVAGSPRTVAQTEPTVENEFDSCSTVRQSPRTVKQ